MRGHFLAELGVCAAHLRNVLCEPVALGAEGLLFVGADVGGGGAHAAGGLAAAGVPHTCAGERRELGVEVAQAVVGCAEVALEGLATERGAGREVVRTLARRRRRRGTSLARVGRAVDVTCPGASRAEREAEHRPSHHPHRPPPARALARFPYRAGGAVLEQDALLAETLANRIRFAEVLATPRLVACGDGRLDLAGAEPGALLAPSAHGL